MLNALTRNMVQSKGLYQSFCKDELLRLTLLTWEGEF